MKFAARSPREGMAGIGSRLAVSRAATCPPSRPMELSSPERPTRVSELGPLTGRRTATAVVVKSADRVQPGATGSPQSSNKPMRTRDGVSMPLRLKASLRRRNLRSRFNRGRLLA